MRLPLLPITSGHIDALPTMSWPPLLVVVPGKIEAGEGHTEPPPVLGVMCHQACPANFLVTLCLSEGDSSQSTLKEAGPIMVFGRHSRTTEPR